MISAKVSTELKTLRSCVSFEIVGGVSKEITGNVVIQCTSKASNAVLSMASAFTLSRRDDKQNVRERVRDDDSFITRSVLVPVPDWYYVTG